MNDPFANPFWHALTTEQADFALGTGQARRYPADIIPFAGIADESAESFQALRDLLMPGEKINVIADQLPEVEGIHQILQIPVLQMQLAADAELSQDETSIETLGAGQSGEMVALTDLAFPGFFRANTYRLGRYFGVRVAGELVAMAGERIALPGWREVSAVCTHPAHTGHGYAGRLIRQLLRIHRESRIGSLLHVTATNTRAIALYARLGFVQTHTFVVRQLERG